MMKLTYEEWSALGTDIKHMDDRYRMVSIWCGPSGCDHRVELKSYLHMTPMFSIDVYTTFMTRVMRMAFKA